MRRCGIHTIASCEQARQNSASSEAEVDPFYDMLFNMLIAFVFCFIIALLAMNPKALKAGDIPAKAEYIITVSWPDMNPNDIDAWVQDPGGNLVWFRAREAGLMHLDRDDRGLANDSIVVNGKQIVNPLNQEVVTLRGIVAGEYVVNAHYYQGKEDAGRAGRGGHRRGVQRRGHGRRKGQQQGGQGGGEGAQHRPCTLEQGKRR